MVEHRGFEPLASTMRMSRATNCANAPGMLFAAQAVLANHPRTTGNSIAHQAQRCKRFFSPQGIFLPATGDGCVLRFPPLGCCMLSPSWQHHDLRLSYVPQHEACRAILRCRTRPSPSRQHHDLRHPYGMPEKALSCLLWHKVYFRHRPGSAEPFSTPATRITKHAALFSGTGRAPVTAPAVPWPSGGPAGCPTVPRPAASWAYRPVPPGLWRSSGDPAAGR